MVKTLRNGVAIDDKTTARLSARRKREDEAHRIASLAARGDPTDPFVYDRVYSHILNGIGEEHSLPTGGAKS